MGVLGGEVILSVTSHLYILGIWKGGGVFFFLLPRNGNGYQIRYYLDKV